MLTSTIYDVKIRYAVDGRGATGVRQLGDEVRSLGRETGKVTGLFRRLGGAVATYLSIRAGAKALVGFNATVQDTKLQIAGMMALAKKTDLSAQLSNANRLFGELQKYAKTHAGSTSDYTEMAGMLTQPILDSGLGMKDLAELTENAVVGAKALHVEWGAAARDIDQALRGQFHSTDVFTGKILGSVGYKGEAGREKYNAMDPAARADALRSALMQKQLTQLAEAQGVSFNGQLSTLQDTIVQFFGKVGEPLFKAISNELERWNKWFDANSGKVDAFAQRLGDGLVTGFNAVKSTVSFLVDHAETLLTIGKVWAAVKIGGMIGGTLGGSGPGGGIAGVGSRIGGAVNFFRGGRDRYNPETGEYEYTKAGRGRQAVGGISGAVGNIGMLGQTFGAAYGIGTVLNDWTGASSAIADGLAHLTGRVDETTDKFFQIQRSMDAFDEAARRNLQGKTGLAATGIMNSKATLIEQYKTQANVIADYLRAAHAGDTETAASKYKAAEAMGLSDSDLTSAKVTSLNAKGDALQAQYGTINLLGQSFWQMGMTQLTDYQKRTLNTDEAQLEAMLYLSQKVAAHEPISKEDFMKILYRNTEDPTGKYKPNMAGKPTFNLNISRIEVQSDDPDRFAFGLVEGFKDAVKNPSQSRFAVREG